MVIFAASSDRLFQVSDLFVTVLSGLSYNAVGEFYFSCRHGSCYV